MNHKSFTKCPACGKEEGTVSTEVQKAVIDGKFPANRKLTILQTQVIIAHQDGMPKVVGIPIKRPVVTAWLDVCWNCGAVYAVDIDIGEITLSLHARQPNVANPDIQSRIFPNSSMGGMGN